MTYKWRWQSLVLLILLIDLLGQEILEGHVVLTLIEKKFPRGKFEIEYEVFYIIVREWAIFLVCDTWVKSSSPLSTSLSLSLHLWLFSSFVCNCLVFPLCFSRYLYSFLLFVSLLSSLSSSSVLFPVETYEMSFFFSPSCFHLTLILKAEK